MYIFQRQKVKLFTCGKCLYRSMVEDKPPWWLKWKRITCNARDLVDPLEMEMAIHSSSLTWEIPRTEKPGSLQSMGSQRVGHSWAFNACTLMGVLWESQLLGRLIRCLRSQRKREGSGLLEEEIGIRNSQERGNDNCFSFFFFLHSLVLVTWNVFFFKPGTDGYTTSNSV